MIITCMVPSYVADSMRDSLGCWLWLLFHDWQPLLFVLRIETPPLLSDETKMTTSVLWKRPNMGSKIGLWFLYSNKVAKHSDLERRNVTRATAEAADKA